MPSVAESAADRLVDELVKRFGEEPLTARDLALELVALDSPSELIGAFDEALSRAAATAETDALDDTLWGPTPTGDELAKARQLAQRAVDEALDDALRGALTREQAAARLGISAQAVSTRLRAGLLVSLVRGRSMRLPAWQFHEGGTLPRLEQLIADYPGSPLSLTSWATTPSVDLDGLTPAEMLTRSDDPQRVLALLETLDARAW